MGEIGSYNSYSMKGTNRYIKNMLVFFLQKNSHSGQMVHFGQKIMTKPTFVACEGVCFRLRSERV